VRPDQPPLRARLPAPPVTRFAPSPTGRLHLGHVANAIHVWGVGRAQGGRVLLRIEDRDRQRCRREYESALLDDLAWLGFEPDAPPVRQSERDAVYRDAIERLARTGAVYGCICTRREIAVAGVAADELVYPGTCRDRGIPLADGVGWRLRVEPGIERFDDAQLGAQEQEPAKQCGDLLVRDRLGNWTYQLVASADDWHQDVSLVIRGTDLLASAGRQIQLARRLGRREPPVFLHHPLVMKSATQKLSKSDRDAGIDALRAAGWSAERVIGEAAHRVGLLAAPAPLAARDLAGLFLRDRSSPNR
jgi:glutamyl-tRNA synthetase/glutamyl-Q tRNA(Asp) synthetase